MKPPRCPVCAGTELADGTFGVHYGASFRLSWFRSVFRFSWLKSVEVRRATCCVECGTITPYVDDATREKVRAWIGTARPAKAAIPEL